MYNGDLWAGKFRVTFLPPSDHEGLSLFVVFDLQRKERVVQSAGSFNLQRRTVISNVSTTCNGKPKIHHREQNMPQHDNTAFDHSRYGWEEEEGVQGCST